MKKVGTFHLPTICVPAALKGLTNFAVDMHGQQCIYFIYQYTWSIAHTANGGTCDEPTFSFLAVVSPYATQIP